MLWTKFKYENKQRAITQKLSKQELGFMCTALPLDGMCPSTKSITTASIVLELCSAQRTERRLPGRHW